MGTKRLYDYIDNNPLFEFHPAYYVNTPSLAHTLQFNKLSQHTP